MPAEAFFIFDIFAIPNALKIMFGNRYAMYGRKTKPDIQYNIKAVMAKPTELSPYDNQLNTIANPANAMLGIINANLMAVPINAFAILALVENRKSLTTDEAEPLIISITNTKYTEPIMAEIISTTLFFLLIINTSQMVFRFIKHKVNKTFIRAF